MRNADDDQHVRKRSAHSEGLQSQSRRKSMPRQHQTNVSWCDDRKACRVQVSIHSCWFACCCCLAETCCKQARHYAKVFAFMPTYHIHSKHKQARSVIAASFPPDHAVMPAEGQSFAATALCQCVQSHSIIWWSLQAHLSFCL